MGSIEYKRFLMEGRADPMLRVRQITRAQIKGVLEEALSNHTDGFK